MLLSEMGRMERMLDELYDRLRADIMAEIDERLNGLAKEAEGVREFRKSMRWLAGQEREP